MCKYYSLNVNFQAKKVNKQYLHSSHQIYVEKYYFIVFLRFSKQNGEGVNIILESFSITLYYKPAFHLLDK